MKKLFSFLALFLIGGISLQARTAQPSKSTPPTPTVILNDGEHLLCGKSRDGKVEFEDGTQFKTLKNDAQKIFEEWDYHEHLVVSSNPYPGGGSDYYIYNVDRGEYVHANFYSEPNRHDAYTQAIFHIDPYYGEIYLRNVSGSESEWQVEEKDFPYLEKWEPNDRVIIGKNSNWIESFRTDCPYIMINCDKNHLKYVRVKRM